MAVDEELLEKKGQDISGWKDLPKSNKPRTRWFRGDVIHIIKDGSPDAEYQTIVKARAFHVPADYICRVLDGKYLFLED
jgi:hypothetical protein